VNNHIECGRDIFHVEEVTGVAAITVKGDCPAAQQLVGEFGDHLLRVLVRAVYVVAARDNERQLEGAQVGLGQELGASLGCSVRVGGFEDVILHHFFLFSLTLAIDFVSGAMDEPLDAMVLGRLEKNVGSHDVVVGELEGVAEGVVCRGLRFIRRSFRRYLI
jgi:hypothetical protein